MRRQSRNPGGPGNSGSWSTRGVRARSVGHGLAWEPEGPGSKSSPAPPTPGWGWGVVAGSSLGGGGGGGSRRHDPPPPAWTPRPRGGTSRRHEKPLRACSPTPAEGGRRGGSRGLGQLTVALPVPAAAIRVHDAHGREVVGAGGHGWGLALHLHQLHHVVVFADGHGAVTQPPRLVLLRRGRRRVSGDRPGAPACTGVALSPPTGAWGPPRAGGSRLGLTTGQASSSSPGRGGVAQEVGARPTLPPEGHSEDRASRVTGRRPRPPRRACVRRAKGTTSGTQPTDLSGRIKV